MQNDTTRAERLRQAARRMRDTARSTEPTGQEIGRIALNHRGEFVRAAFLERPDGRGHYFSIWKWKCNIAGRVSPAEGLRLDLPFLPELADLIALALDTVPPEPPGSAA
jgi:hypothetical protein